MPVPCVAKIKVTCWQLRDNMWDDEWPWLLVKVGSGGLGMNGSLSPEYSLKFDKCAETDSPNYGGSSKEWPWDDGRRIHTCTCTYPHRQHIVSRWENDSSHLWLPSVGPERFKTTQHTPTHSSHITASYHPANAHKHSRAPKRATKCKIHMFSEQRGIDNRLFVYTHTVCTITDSNSLMQLH